MSPRPYLPGFGFVMDCYVMVMVSVSTQTNEMILTTALRFTNTCGVHPT